MAHAAAGLGEGDKQGVQDLRVREEGWELEGNDQEWPNLVVPGSEAKPVFLLQREEKQSSEALSDLSL